MRRLDWRFLLPGSRERPERVALLGADGDVLAAAREVGLASEVRAALPDAGTVDAIAVLHSARVRPSELAGRLAPEGVFYWEVDRLRDPARRPSVLRRELERVGLRVLDVYWVSPGFRQTTAYVSLEAAHALEWYFRTLFVPRTRLRRAGMWAVGAWTGWRPGRFASAAARYALIGGGHARAPVGPAVFGLDGEGRGSGGHAVMLVGGQGEWSRVTLLAFEPDGRAPARVLKAARSPAFRSSIEGEQRTLAQVRDRLGPELRDSVPEPLGCHPWMGTVVGVEEFVAGRSMGASLADRRAGWEDRREELRDAVGWLTELHFRSTVMETWGAAIRAEMVEAPLRRYASVFGRSNREARAFEATRTASEALDGTTFPRVRWHRDFQPSNVFRDGDRVRVVDWEVSTEGPALIDLVYFLFHWACRACDARSESARQELFRRLFLRPDRGRAATAAEEELARYRDRLGIDARYVPIFVLITMVELTLDRAGRMRALGRPDWFEREANPHTAYVGLLAEGR